MNYPFSTVGPTVTGALTFTLYYLRHRRKNLAIALLGVNIGAFTMTTALSTTTVGVGLGFGLLGVLLIIRLRSIELSQAEMAYYFVVLVIGPIGGVSEDMFLGIAALPITAIIFALAATDPKLMMAGSSHTTLAVDRTFSNPEELARCVEHRTDMKVREVSIVKLDYVNGSTMVDIRCSKGWAQIRETKSLRAA